MMTGGGQQLLHRSDSELSSCCMSEVDSSSSSAISATSTATSENGFDTDHHEGGTIRRKTGAASATLMSTAVLSANAAIEPPPPPSPSVIPIPSSLPVLLNDSQHLQRQLVDVPRQLGDVPRQLTESDMSLNSLPPPPEELRHLHRIQSLSASATCDHHIQPIVHQTVMVSNGIQHQQQHVLMSNGIQQQTVLMNNCSQQQQPIIANNSLIVGNGNVQYQQQEQQQQQAIREEIYPCGIPRVMFHPGLSTSAAATTNVDSQMDLLKMLPNNPPPRPFTVPVITREQATPDLKSLLKTPTATPAVVQPVTQARRRRITFNELVHSVDDDDETEYHQLKCDDVTPTPEDCDDTYSERDVSNWVLQSLKHCRVGDAPTNGDVAVVPPVTLPIISHDLRPKIYNGRSVPNCFPPGEADPTPRPTQLLSSLVQPQMCPGFDPRRKIGPPPPPKRSQHTMLTSPT